MKTLEQHILGEYLAAKALTKVSHISIEQEEDEIYLIYTTDKPRKLKITNKLWASLREMYELYVATSMLREGYMLCPIEGGYIVVGGEDNYQIHEDTCTCPHYIFTKKKCQHLVFRDWHLNYRARCNTYSL